MPWWAYDSEANTLYLGSVNGKQTVTCDAYNHPWKGIIDTTKIETVITCGQLAPTSMVGWFGSGDAYAYDLVDGGRYRIKAQNHSSGTYIPNWGAGLTTNGNSPYVFWDIELAGQNSLGKYYRLRNVGTGAYLDYYGNTFYIRNFSTSGWNRSVIIPTSDTGLALDRPSNSWTAAPRWWRGATQLFTWMTDSETANYENAWAFDWSFEHITGGFLEPQGIRCDWSGLQGLHEYCWHVRGQHDAREAHPQPI